MELEKIYPWTTQLKIPTEKLEEWKSQKTSSSLTAWSLKNSLIDKRQYSQWAVDHYQIPLVKDLFFQEYVMAKKHWDELKEKYNWTEEIFPIAVWNQTLFLGCIEPPSNKIQIPGFDVRLVLVNYSSLENRWHFIQKFLNPPSHKQRIFKEETQNTNYKLKQHLSKPAPPAPSLAPPASKLASAPKLASASAPKSAPALKASFQPDLPVEKPRTPLKLMPTLQKSEALKKLDSSQQPAPQNTNLKKNPLSSTLTKIKATFQKPEVGEKTEGSQKPEVGQKSKNLQKLEVGQKTEGSQKAVGGQKASPQATMVEKNSLSSPAPKEQKARFQKEEALEKLALQPIALEKTPLSAPASTQTASLIIQKSEGLKKVASSAQSLKSPVKSSNPPAQATQNLKKPANTPQKSELSHSAQKPVKPELSQVQTPKNPELSHSQKSAPLKMVKSQASTKSELSHSAQKPAKSELSQVQNPKKPELSQAQKSAPLKMVKSQASTKSELSHSAQNPAEPELSQSTKQAKKPELSPAQNPEKPKISQNPTNPELSQLQKPKLSHSQTVTKSELLQFAQTQNSTHSEKTENPTNTSTSFSILCTQQEYADLWKYTHSYYSASLILEIQKGGKATISSWNGRVDVSNEQLSLDLNEGPSLFKVVQKGMTYNGYVIDNPFHKKFFKQIGWSEYPKHLSAIPIKDSHKTLKQIFIGLSTKSFSQGELKTIESQILKFFDTKTPQLKVA